LGGWHDEALVGLLGQLAELDDGLAGVGYGHDDYDDLLALLAGPPDLDDLADDYNPDDDDQRLATVRLTVPPDVADRWKLHAAAFDSDGDALASLLA
jgi:hypothetical protein